MSRLRAAWVVHGPSGLVVMGEDVDVAAADLQVESAWGAVSMLPPVRFPRPLAE
jgi:hypothetical protein